MSYEMPSFRVLSAAPGKRTAYWTYISDGASAIEHDDSGRQEFLIISPIEDLRQVELVTMTAWYHRHTSLGRGHTIPIGQPWVDNSNCNHILISTPYPFGPDLEICNVPDGHIHFLWMLPITQAERDFKMANDLESLEQQFENAPLEYWDVSRKSVI